MVKYWYDTEFLEGTQKKSFLGIPYGNTKPTIDIISIGIVCEDGREYYAISKDFNLKEAWNRYDVKEQTPFEKYNDFSGRKVYWIRENVLRPIWEDLKYKHFNKENIHPVGERFTYKNLKKLINLYGKRNTQIKKEIKQFYQPSRAFVRDWYETKNSVRDNKGTFEYLRNYELNFDKEYESYQNPILYGYYSAYDHVALCWLFGNMIDLPTGFPMYTIDLKQELDNKERLLRNNDGDVEIVSEPLFDDGTRIAATFRSIKELPYYPKQSNAHNALSDARWNKELYEFLNNL